MSIVVENNKIHLTSGKLIEFPCQITEVIYFEKVIVLCLSRECDEEQYKYKNVIGCDYIGNILWQIMNIENIGKGNPIVGIIKDLNTVKVVTWEGSYAILDPMTGRMLVSPHESMRGKKLW